MQNLFKTLGQFILISLISLLTSCNNNSNESTQTISENKPKTEVQTLFDITKLDRKNIDEVRKILGKPSDETIEPTKQQLKMDIDTWENNFEKNGESLLVTFNPKTRNVIDFFISSNDSSETSESVKDMLQVCGIKETDNRFIIEPIKSLKNPEKYTGVTIKFK